jgi:hypothetical protein
LSYPISGCINIEANIKSAVLKCGFIDQILDVRTEVPEMVIIPPQCFAKNVKIQQLYHTFRVMLGAKIIVTSDEIRAMDIFLLMRRTERAHPRGEFSGLCEKIVI